jgi:hypothetical protein
MLNLWRGSTLGRLLGRMSPAAWLIAAVLVFGPWYLAYFALVLRWTGVVTFWMPVQ